MTLAHFLDGLRCACCGTLNVLWLDPVRSLVECRNCRRGARLLDEDEETR